MAAARDDRLQRLSGGEPLALRVGGGRRDDRLGRSRARPAGLQQPSNAAATRSDRAARPLARARRHRRERPPPARFAARVRRAASPGVLWFAAGDALHDARRESLLDAAARLIADDALARTAGVTAPQPEVVVLRVLAPSVEPAMRLLTGVGSLARRRLDAAPERAAGLAHLRPPALRPAASPRTSPAPVATRPQSAGGARPSAPARSRASGAASSGRAGASWRPPCRRSGRVGRPTRAVGSAA